MKTIRFAENLKRIREWREMTKEELGERVGVSGVTIGYWENGRNEPRMGKVEQIASVLNVDIDDLLFNEDLDKIKANSKSLISDVKKQTIDLIKNLNDEDVELFKQLMERSINKSE
ncbi:helix-turn-helix transcriptional regulator [Paenibacillus apis]|nr:helix-turn-helix transcriptional regulator [Paenibacillus apis]